jgi:hypothetical protein
MKHSLKIALLLGSLVGLGLLYYFLNPALSSFFPQCPFFRITGYLCPGCGAQRAFHELLHGHIGQAARHNLLLVLSLPLLVYVGLISLKDGKKDTQLSFLYSRTFLCSTLAIVLTFWLLRNLSFAPFQWLVP